jgi:hypothetical protein
MPMNEDTQLATAQFYRQATDVAGVCKAIVLKTAMPIQGRKYVKVEGWMSIATAHGCVASARNVEKVEGGFRAIGEIRRISDGAVLATAEGFVGEDEATWFGGGPKNLPKRPEYAIRAMCQTRAISRACRTAFAHVVVMMDAGLSTTPAEEVPDGGFQDSHPDLEPSKPPATAAQRQEPRNVTPPKQSSNAKTGGWRDVQIHFGKKQGVTLGTLEAHGELDWWMNTWEPKPYKGVIDPINIALREALDAAKAEIHAVPAGHDGPQQAFPTDGTLDEDTPF